MGNTSLAQQYGSLYVQTNNPNYQPGQMVSGYVGSNFHQPFQSSAIFIKIVGRGQYFILEKVYFKESEQQSYQTVENGQTVTKYKTVYHDRQGENVFFQQNIPIYQLQMGFIPIGQYQIPFQFMLPDNLPGSFEYQVGGELPVKAKILYSIKAYTFQGCSPQWSFMKLIKDDQISYKQYFTMREPLKYNSQQSKGEMTQDMKTWCCIDKGTSKITAYFEKNVYTVNDTAVMYAEVDNSNCKLNIENVAGELHNKVTLRADGGRTKTIYRQCCTVYSGPVAAGVKAVDKDMKTLNLSLISDPQNPILPTTGGTLIISDNFLKVFFNFKCDTKFEGCICCINTPDVSIPIQLYLFNPINYGTVQAPQGWAPQIEPIYDVQFSQQYAFNGGGVQYCNFQYLEQQIGMQPISGMQQPQMVMQQPQMVMQQPQMGMQQPQMGMQQPQMGMQQPQMGMQQPYMGRQ